MIEYFRARNGVNLINQVNKKIVSKQGELTGLKRGEKTQKKAEKGEEKSEPKNQGKLIVDATCAPANIKYPNDLGIFNQSSKQT